MLKIVTDSTCDMTTEQATDLGIEMVPLRVQFGQQTYLDKIDLTTEQFYEKLTTSEELPTTSQVSPTAFETVFAPYLAAEDEVLGIFLSSELSGTFESAQIAKQNLNSDHIFLVDSKSATLGIMQLVQQAVVMRDAGLSVQEIVVKLELLVPKLRIFAVVDTLKYLHKGGRLSSAGLLVGNVLGITPIVAVKDGKVASIGKARGRKSAYKFIAKQIAQNPIDVSFPAVLAHAEAKEDLASFESFLNNTLPEKPAYAYGEIGSVIGTHTGPGVIGIAYFTK